MKPRILASIIIEIGHPCNMKSLHKSRGNSLRNQNLQMNIIPCAKCSHVHRVQYTPCSAISETGFPNLECVHTSQLIWGPLPDEICWSRKISRQFPSPCLLPPTPHSTKMLPFRKALWKHQSTWLPWNVRAGTDDDKFHRRSVCTPPSNSSPWQRLLRLPPARADKSPGITS